MEYGSFQALLKEKSTGHMRKQGEGFASLGRAARSEMNPFLPEKIQGPGKRELNSYEHICCALTGTFGACSLVRTATCLQERVQ